MASSKPTSIKRLRMLILIALVAGLTLFTGVMFTLVQRLSERFGPEVQADLVWRAERGAQELAKTADVGLAVDDASMVKDAFGAYAHTSDVQAIVAVDAAGHIVAQHGTFADTAIVFALEPGSVFEGPGYLASWAPASIEGAQIGKVAVVVSTARLSDAQTALLDVSRTTVIAGVVGLLLGCLVILFFTRAVAVRDQQLNDYAHNLERKVEERTRELDERNRGMRLVLDNVAQGFLTIDASGVLATERSAVVDHWFGAITPETKFGAVVRAHDPSFATWFELGLEALHDGVLPRELCLDQMPRRFGATGRTFDVAYSPILDGDVIVQMLVIVSDVTAEIERERTEREQREIVELFQRITSDRAGFDEFFADASGLVDKLRVPSDDVTEKRLIHTLKGNCGVYGVHSFAALCNEIETELADAGARLSVPQRQRLDDGWRVVVARLAKLFGERKQHVVEIPEGDLHALVAKARKGVATRELAATLASWTREPVAIRFERLARQAVALGHRLGKAELDVTIDDGRIRLDTDRWVGFWASMIHAVRNAVDHGIETAAERIAAGKSPRATFALEASHHEGHLVIALADDGRGIAWEAVRAKAARHGLPSVTSADLVAALFADGLSTRDEASDTSGRGVGLGALRAAITALGGTVDVTSSAGAGTRFEFRFPDAAAELRPPTQPIRIVV